MGESKGPAAGGDRRSPDPGGRRYVLSVRLSGAEKAKAEAAAGKAGMRLSAWAGEVIVDAAEWKALPVSRVHRELLAELTALRGPLRMAVASLGKAVGKPDATGLPGGDPAAARRYLLEVAAKVDAAAERVRRSL